MKFINSADFHFSAYNNDKIDKESKLPERLNSLFVTITNIILFGIKNNIKTFVVAGDLFHNKSIIYSIAQSLFLDIVRNYPEMHWIIVDGNHDMTSMTGDGVSATKCLDNEINVTTIHKTTKIENMLFVPWNPITMKSDIIHGESDYLVSHLGLNEGKLNSGISIISDIGLKDLKQYKHAFLGHYHAPQNFGNATYIGSPVQLDFGEKNDIKRFLVVDSESGLIESIPTEGYKKYCELNISKDNKYEILKEAENLKKNGHHVKINLKDDIDTSDFSKDLIIVDKREKDITNRGVNSEMSMADKLEKYLEIKKIPKEKWDLYKNKALEIIEGSNI